ncbi:MAG: DUF559 domain-containing protein [bacterium]
MEVDGGQHYGLEGKKKDELRDEYISLMRLKVLRFSDYDMLKNIVGLLT